MTPNDLNKEEGDREAQGGGHPAVSIEKLMSPLSRLN
jgi:hypothetical protein